MLRAHCIAKKKSNESKYEERNGDEVWTNCLGQKKKKQSKAGRGQGGEGREVVRVVENRWYKIQRRVEIPAKREVWSVCSDLLALLGTNF